MTSKDSTLISLSALAEGKLSARLAAISMPDVVIGDQSLTTDWIIYINSVLSSFNIAKFGSNAPGGSHLGLDASRVAANGTRLKGGVSGIWGVDYLGCNIAALTDGPTVTPDFATQSFIWKLSAGGSRTIAQPTNLPSGGSGFTNNFTMIFDLLNNTAGAITTTFNAFYKLAGAWTDPAAGKRRTMLMYYDGVNLIEVSRAAADI
jgi:hypothetical protein